MAGMDLTARRANRGISVFWMILGMGAGVFALLAILLVGTEEAVEPLPYDEGAEIVVNEGETMVNGVAGSQAQTNENDATFLGDTVTVDGPLPEGDLSTQDVEVDVSAGEPVGGAVVDPEEAGTDADAGVEDIVNDEGALARDEPAQADIVVDPDGTTAPVVPTPSGPEGRDGETIADDLGITD